MQLMVQMLVLLPSLTRCDATEDMVATQTYEPRYG
jgi:hypothetical protein